MEKGKKNIRGKTKPEGTCDGSGCGQQFYKYRAKCLRKKMRNAGVSWLQKIIFYLERGPYDIISVMDEGVKHSTAAI